MLTLHILCTFHLIDTGVAFDFLKKMVYGNDGFGRVPFSPEIPWWVYIGIQRTPASKEMGEVHIHSFTV